jgi:hypothetical protein
VADVGLERPGLARAAPRERAAARERFFSPARAAGIGLFVVFGLTFGRPRVFSDGILYDNFVRRLFGEDVLTQAYQFGSAFWAAPFYLGSRLVAARGELGVHHATVVGNLLAANAAGFVTLYLGWRILRELDLPRGPAALLLTLFGSPLWWYVFLEPSWKQAADTLYVTAAIWFLLRAWKEPLRSDLAACAGICVGFMLATRYANAALLLGFAVALWPHARRALLVLGASAAVTAAVLYAVPVVRGIPFTPPSAHPPWQLTSGVDAPLGLQPSPSMRLAAGPDGAVPFFGIPGTDTIKLDLLAPLKMLFTLERGLYFWTPLTAFACIGFALLLRRDRRHRSFLLGLLVAALALLWVHALWGANWTGSSYSARFLTSLFAFFLLGTAELLRRWRLPATAVLALCTVWSVWIGLVILNGYTAMSGSDGVDKIAGTYVRFGGDPPPENLEGFSHELGDRIADRWRLLWHVAS